MTNKFKPIGGVEPQSDVTIGRIDAVLRLTPDGIYRIDGRVIPVGNHAGLCVDDGQLVSGIHDTINNSVGLSGAVLGVDVPK